ncbi:MAG: glycoside hydrolase family 2 [Ruminococcaceae bacterium]|nr:glycoside hydrolase family 2 [Oscillospiraceae bacterium]
MKTVSLETDFEKELEKSEIPFCEYPRPQLKRDSFLCLNGKWNFKIKNNGKVTFSGDILVPFVPESRISGIERSIKKRDILVYERTFTLEKSFLRDRLMLHIGACDQYTTVFVNGRAVGENIGGYLPFCFDITDYVTENENVITVEAKDPLCKDLPYGKQTEKRGGMWYTKISGIWQTVWLESVPDNFIEKIKITPNLCGVDIEVFGGEQQKTISFEGVDYNFSGEKFRLNVENPILWSPDNPHLYEFMITSGKDTVKSYFGLRTVSIEQINGRPLIFLNGKPLFFNGLLDQGYFSDGIFLPASESGFKFDILSAKKCGFNMLRKHIKMEPQLFYYYCDKYGMLIFQDMINCGKYSFLIDTALPTIGIKKQLPRRFSKRCKSEFESSAFGILENLYNHPSVVYYTIFNEGWGQFSADECYKKFKEFDSTRIYDTTSGWFQKNLSDVQSEHIYFKRIKFKKSYNRPLILSEFGGYSCKIENHSFNLDKTYGYRFFESRSEFESALVSLYEDEIIPAIKNGLCGAVLTQLSDVEDETNGLLTYDRKVLKVDEKRIKRLCDKLYDDFFSFNIKE